jgi:hypothetical protein
VPLARRGLTLNHSEAMASLTAPVLEGFHAGKTSCDLAGLLTVETSAPICLGLRFDSPQVPYYSCHGFGDKRVLTKRFSKTMMFSTRKRV